MYLKDSEEAASELRQREEDEFEAELNNVLDHLADNLKKRAEQLAAS